MSLPAAMAPQVMPAMVSVNPLDMFLQLFNTNPYFIGIMMLVLNLGGRFISLEVTKKQELFFQHPWVRRVLIFTVLFVATRNIWVAFWTTVIVVLFLGYLFNENSSLCLFGSGGISGSSCSEPHQTYDEMTPEEKEILQRLSAKAHRYQSSSQQKSNPSNNPQQQALQQSTNPQDNEDDVLLTDIYSANVSLLTK
jgi:hypothetical protein